jgi:hypothetical protein
MLRFFKNLFTRKPATPAADPAEIARHVAAAMAANPAAPAPAPVTGIDPAQVSALIANAAKQAVAAALAAEFAKADDAEPQPDPLAQLEAQARECAELVDLDEDGEQFTPEQVARTVAVVLPLLARLHSHVDDFVAVHWPTRGARYAEDATKHLDQAGEQAAVVAGWIACRPAEVSGADENASENGSEEETESTTP